MKSISFSKGIEKDIHININMNYYEEFLSKYLSRYGSLLIMDSGLKKYFNYDGDNVVFVKGGPEAKYFDKYVELCKLITNGDYSNIIVVGGGSLIDMVGFTYNTLDFPKASLIIVPTTLSSMIYLPVSGEFNLDMNYTKNYLKVSGYPDLVYIDPYFCKFLDKSVMKKQFIFGYLVGLLFDKTFAKLSLKYSKNFIKLDLEEYLYTAIRFVLSLYSNDLVFPGTRLSKFLIEPDFKMNNFFVESECLSFVFLSYLSHKLGYLSELNFKSIVNDIKNSLSFSNLPLRNLKAKKFSIPLNEILLTDDGFISYYINYTEIEELLPEFKVFVRSA
ncbi:MAG TPA: hypothetical protein PK894_00445 [Defluviitoga sp.]|nr:hypothetical protein [Defluviitoga sp.]HOP24239.1 hypothetical protein [Defluviitoga sp.]HPZ28169.1 hypothetical protein [Defluviitoga sp.]HQD62059.1 hypothetical protein [Defluviitoga sp.]